MTRWIKVFRDLWNNRVRTSLVILSIAVGVFAMGMIAAAQESLTRSLNAQYAALRPADAILLTEPLLDGDFIEGLRTMRGVEAAEGRRALALRISLDVLVINVISALIAQQEKQIGIMKAIGARSRQVIGLYFGMVLILGLLACLPAIPLSLVGARALTAFVAGLMNFDPPQVEFTPATLILQLGVGLLVPLLAAAPAILTGTRVSPARVLSEYGISQVWAGAGLLDRLLRRFPRLTRDILLALRNPFRKRGRLVLSLVTLTFAGAVFMAIVNLQASLNHALDQMLGFWRYDAWLIVDDYAPAGRIAPGQSAAIKLDAFPDEEFRATVTAIERVGRPYRGDMTCRVTLTLDRADPRFMWNMTATVNIVVRDYGL